MDDIGVSMTWIADVLESVAKQAREAGENKLRLWLVCPASPYPEGGNVPAIVVRAETKERARMMATKEMDDGDTADGWLVSELTANGPAGIVVARGSYLW